MSKSPKSTKVPLSRYFNDCERKMLTETPCQSIPRNNFKAEVFLKAKERECRTWSQLDTCYSVRNPRLGKCSHTTPCKDITYLPASFCHISQFIWLIFFYTEVNNRQIGLCQKIRKNTSLFIGTVSFFFLYTYMASSKH